MVLLHKVVLQTFSALTKYVVVIVGYEFNVAPEPSKLPPQEPEYQYQLAPEPKLPPVWVRDVKAPEQTFDGEAAAETAATDKVLIVTVTGALPLVQIGETHDTVTWPLPD